MILDTSKAFAPTTKTGAYAAPLQRLRKARHSGIYAILQGSRVLYVGESHSGRLYDTLTRHFRDWKIKTLDDGRTSGGTTYDRAKVRVVFKTLPASEAEAAQFTEIARLNPRDNTATGDNSRKVRRIEANPPPDAIVHTNRHFGTLLSVEYRRPNGRVYRHDFKHTTQLYSAGNGAYLIAPVKVRSDRWIRG